MVADLMVSVNYIHCTYIAHDACRYQPGQCPGLPGPAAAYDNNIITDELNYVCAYLPTDLRYDVIAV